MRTIPLLIGTAMLLAPAPGPGQAPARGDAYGDPLPLRALARLGTVRLRHAGYVEAIAFAPDGKTVASGGREGAIRFWDVRTGKEVLTLPGHKGGAWTLAFSPDGKSLVSGGPDSTVRQWDVTTGKQRLAITGQAQEVWRVAFSPDGRTIASGDRSGKAKLWDAVSGKAIRAVGNYKHSVFALAFSPNGRTLALCDSQDARVSLWDVATGRELLQLDHRTEYPLTVAFTPDGRAVVTLGRSLRFWDAVSGKELGRLRLGDSPPGAMAFRPGSTTLLVNGTPSDPRLRLIDWVARKERGFLPGTFEGVCSFGYSPDGKTLALGEAGSVVRLVDAATSRPRLKSAVPAGWVRAVAFSLDGKSLATAGGRNVRLWEVPCGREYTRLPHQDVVACLAFAPRGRLLATAEGRTLPATFARPLRIWDLASAKSTREMHAGRHDHGILRAVAFSPNGRTLATTCQYDKLLLWDTTSGQELLRRTRLHYPTSALSFSPDGAALAVGMTQGVVRIWEMPGGKELPSLAGHRGWVNGLAFSADGQVLATAGQDKTVRLSEVVTRKAILTIPLPAEATAVALSPDGKLLAASDADGTVRLWSAATGKERLTLRGHKGEVDAIAFAPNGKLLASGSRDTTALLWDVSGLPPEKPARQRLTAANLREMWEDLALSDAARAHAAVAESAAHPEQSVPFLRERLLASTPKPGQLDRLVAGLDSDKFVVREKATQELEALGRLVEPNLRQALQGKPSLEVRRRVEGLLRKLERQPLSPSLLRLRRAVRGLGLTRGEEARQLLDKLAERGIPEAKATLRPGQRP
jgi:WD40 repeat protein